MCSLLFYKRFTYVSSWVSEPLPEVDDNSISFHRWETWDRKRKEWPRPQSWRAVGRGLKKGSLAPESSLLTYLLCLYLKPGWKYWSNLNAPQPGNNKHSHTAELGRCFIRQHGYNVNHNPKQNGSYRWIRQCDVIFILEACWSGISREKTHPLPTLPACSWLMMF